MTRGTLMPTILCKARDLRQRLDALHADARQDIDPNAPGYTPGLSKQAMEREP